MNKITSTNTKASQKCKKILVAGIGNRLMSDDGIGSVVAEELSKQIKLENVDIIDYGISAIALLHDLANYEHVIIIDAIQRGDTPGSMYHIRLTAEDIIAIDSENVTDFFHLSFHEVDIERILAFAKAIGNLPLTIEIIGIEPKIIDPGLNLSTEVRQKIPTIKKLVLSLINA